MHSIASSCCVARDSTTPSMRWPHRVPGSRSTARRNATIASAQSHSSYNLRKLSDVCTPQDRVDSKSACYRFARSRNHKMGRRITVHRPGTERVQTRPREGIVRGQLSRVSERLDRLLRSLRSQLLPKMTPMQIQILGHRILRLTPANRLEALRRERQPNLFRNCPAQLALQR